jgi:hypothetical protein
MPLSADHRPLVRRAPLDRPARTLLFAVRRIAMEGLNDALAANTFLGLFGLAYRRPLVLLRALMAELARSSQRSILVAPCCCLGLTDCEALLLDAIAVAPGDQHGAAERLIELTATGDCLGALTTAHALGQAFEDLGRPLSR